MLTYFSTIIESRRKAETVLNTLIGLRLTIVLLSLVTFWQGGPIPGSSLPLYVLLIVSCVLSAAYAVLSKLRVDLNDLNAVQVLMDVIFISVLVYLTGGNDSKFVFLYMVTVVGAALFLSSRAAWLVASLSVIGISIIAILYKTDHFPEYTPQEIREQYQQWDQFWRVFTTTHLTHSFGILIIAGLAGALAQRVFQSRLLQEEILENLNEAVLLVDPKGAIVYRNAQVAQFLRPVPVPRLRGPVATLDTLFHPLDLARIRPYLEKPVRIDFILQDSAQVERTIEAGVIPLKSLDSGGGIIIQMKDVSIERMLEDNARERQRLEAMREIGAMMAHEVRNPLATVRGYAQEIMRRAAPADVLTAQAQAILEQSDRIDSIIETFLRFSRMPAPEPFLADLGELADRVIASLEVRPDAGNVEFLLELDPPGKTKQARFDPSQLEQVLLNLGINALQAMDAAQPDRRLCIRLAEALDQPETGGQESPAHRAPGPTADPADVIDPAATALAQADPARPGILITIEDSGPGLPKAHPEAIFKPFFTTKTTGTGLGLSIAMKIIHSHAGWIKTGTSRWGGARFAIFLPE